MIIIIICSPRTDAAFFFLIPMPLLILFTCVILYWFLYCFLISFLCWYRKSNWTLFELWFCWFSTFNTMKWYTWYWKSINTFMLLTTLSSRITLFCYLRLLVLWQLRPMRLFYYLWVWRQSQNKAEKRGIPSEERHCFAVCNGQKNIDEGSDKLRGMWFRGIRQSVTGSKLELVLDCHLLFRCQFFS